MSRSRPADACSVTDAALIVFARAARPARSGWARSSGELLAPRPPAADHGAHRRVQLDHVAEGTGVPGSLGHPRRALEDGAECCPERRAIHGVERRAVRAPGTLTIRSHCGRRQSVVQALDFGRTSYPISVTPEDRSKGTAPSESEYSCEPRCSSSKASRCRSRTWSWSARAAGEVLVRMAASGVCHSCLHAADGSWKGVPVPIVLGDEGAGDRGGGRPRRGRSLDDRRPRRPLVGADVRALPLLRDRPAEPLRASPARAAACCPTAPRAMSLRGRAGLSLRPRGDLRVVAPSCTSRARSRSIPRWRSTSAALIGCSVMTGVGAVINTAAVPPGASMAVFGVGGVGLNVVQGGALVAAHPIIAVDVKRPSSSTRAALGASHVVRRLARGRAGGHPSSSRGWAPTTRSSRSATHGP